VSPRPPVLAAAVVTLPGGQTRFSFPGVARSSYATGQQEPCTDCSAAGRAGQGVSRDGPGSAPLCLSCWDERRRRAPRRGSLTPEEAGQLAELQEQLACPACRPGTAAAAVDLPPAAVEAARRRRRRDRARGRRPGPTPRRTGPRRRTGCWRCADARWLAEVRAVHERDQAAAAADVERVDELRAVHRRTVRAVARARKRLGYMQAWQARVAGVVEALPKLTKTGSRSRLELKAGPGSKARGVWLIADFLARQAAERAERGVTGRGRPPQHHLVVGVMAIAADPAAGLRSMAGLNPTAAFAGVTTRTVTNAWDYAELVGTAVEAERGRTCSLAEREETGLHRRRSVYDFAQLCDSPLDPQPFLGGAAGVVATLLQRAVQLVDEHQAVLEEAERASAVAEAELVEAQAVVAERAAEDLLLQASVSDAWADDAKAAYKVARTARGRANLAAGSPADQDLMAAARAGREGRERLVATVQGAFETALRMDSFFHPPRMGPGKRSSSALRGLLFSAQPTSPLAGDQRPTGRGREHKGGASRPSPTRSVTNPPMRTHPRTPERVRPGSSARARRSAVMAWAKPLAKGLAGRWEFLARFLDDADNGRRDQRAVARERALRLAMIATTLASRLSRRWTPAQVVALVEQYGLTGRYAGVRTVISPGDAHSPLRYLTTVLDRALSNPDAIVPCYSPVRAAFERDVLAVELATQAEHTAALQAELAEQSAAAAADRAAGRQDGLHAARATVAAADGRTVPRPTRHREPGDAERMAAVRAELAARAAAAAPAEPGRGEQPWSEPVAQVGAGLPDGWIPGRDR
jgi:hypothetical protein